MLTVDVVIPTWERAELVASCALAFGEQDREHRLIVVDNGSRDGTVTTLRGLGVEVVALPRNVGFGAAVAAGAAAGTGDVIVVTNNDVLPEPGFLTELVRPMEQDRSLAAVSGVLLDAEGSSVDAAGVVVDAGLAGYSHLHGAPLTALDDAAPPLGPCGGAAGYRRDVWEELGGFDPELFAYSEDVDLALRLEAAGHRCGWAPRARARHLGSATLGRRTVAQLERSAWARGYVLGRYRVPTPWVALELAVGGADAVLHRSLVPLQARRAGLRHGRGLPVRTTAGGVSVGLGDGLRRRVRAVRG